MGAVALRASAYLQSELYMELSRLNELLFEHNCVAAMKLEMVDF